MKSAESGEDRTAVVRAQIVVSLLLANAPAGHLPAAIIDVDIWM
jgi:hypothetical protein